MQINGIVGPSSGTDGVPLPLRQGKLGDLLVSELHGRYFEAALRQKMFGVANQAGQVTTVGLATTYTGLGIANPVGGAVNIALHKVFAAFPVPPAAASVIGLMLGYNVGTNISGVTAITARSHLFGTGGGATATPFGAATLPTAPFLDTVFGTIDTGAITTAPNQSMLGMDFEGSIILPPGAYACIYTSTASGAAGMFASMSWEEVPV